uniref:Metastasis-associated protein MTA1 R1 domain-containing protein n=1 Tax=Homalodisca liturata TaxID=320908 RepID=A0A1B6IC03_9HEMI
MAGTLMGKTTQELKELLRCPKKERGSVTNIATRLGLARHHELIVPDWLAPTDKDKLPRQDRIAFPKPPKAPDGSLMYERVPNKPEAEKAAINNISPSLKRRTFEDMNGMDGVMFSSCGPPVKRPREGPVGPRTVVNHLNGKTRVGSSASRIGRKQVISWMDAPDDVYFRSTDATKKVRRQLTAVELRRAARKPWRKLTAKGFEDMVVHLE